MPWLLNPSSSCLLFWRFWRVHPPSCQWQCMASNHKYCTKSTVLLPQKSRQKRHKKGILPELYNSTGNKHSSAKPRLVLLAELPMAVCSNQVQQIGHDMPKIKKMCSVQCVNNQQLSDNGGVLAVGCRNQQGQ